jgi:hypothetical protein
VIPLFFSMFLNFALLLLTNFTYIQNHYTTALATVNYFTILYYNNYDKNKQNSLDQRLTDFNDHKMGKLNELAQQ